MSALAQLNLIGSALGLLLATALLTRTGCSQRCWRMLGLLLAVGVAITAIMVLYETRAIAEYPLLIGVHTPMVFLIGPLFWAFCLLYQDHRRPWRALDVLHLLPFVLYVVWLWPIYTLPEAVKVQRVLGAFYADTPRYQRVQVLHMSAALVHLGVYLVAGWRRLGSWSGMDPSVRIPALGMAGIWGVMAVRFLFDTVGEWTTAGTALITPTASSLLILVIAFSALRGARLERRPQTPYARSGMNPDQARQIADELDRVVRDRKWYREPDLSLSALAQRAGFSRHQITEALNVGREQRFSDFVNGLRVEEARQRILSATGRPNFTRLAEEVGFASRTSFYNAFRRHLGCAPGDLVPPD